MYQVAIVRYGRHGSAIASTSAGFGSSFSPYSFRTAARNPKSPTGSTSGRPSPNISSMLTAISWGVTLRETPEETPMTTAKDEGTAYSYIRFSSREQEQGDSVRRQRELRDRWLAAHPGVRLDTSLSLEDLGVSAYRGRHRLDDKYKLGQFLKLLDTGRIAPGSYLIVESLDRLTREEIGEGTELFLSIVNRGVRVVQLMPQEHVFAKPVQLTELILAIVELSRAGSESAAKGERVSQAWSRRKRRAAAGSVVTRRCPAWLRVVGDRFEFRPGAKDLLTRMFDMCSAGHGCRGIAAAFNREKVPTWGKGKWDEAYVRKIIVGRAVLGEYQPMKGRGAERVADPTLAPVPNYYPAAVTQSQWDRAAGARKVRDRRGGRPPKDDTHVNVFAGLLRDATTGDTLQINNRIDDHGRLYRVLVPSGYKRHGAKCVSFPLDRFEEALLSELAEIDPREILPDSKAGDRVLELSGRLARVERRLAEAKAHMTDGDQDLAPLMAAIRELETRRKATADELAAARREVATPAAEALGECRGLVQTLASLPDQRDARVRLRGALRRVVTDIRTLFVPLGAWRLALVQVWFDGGAHRDYLVRLRPARPNHGKMVPQVFKHDAVKFPDSLGADLRSPADAADLEKWLRSLDLKG